LHHYDVIVSNSDSSFSDVAFSLLQEPGEGSVTDFPPRTPPPRLPKLRDKLINPIPNPKPNNPKPM